MADIELVIKIPEGLKKDFELEQWTALSCMEMKNALEKATPLPKGHWIMTSDYLTTAYGSVDYVKCSCCGEDSLEEGNYCPNCGAKMESEE